MDQRGHHQIGLEFLDLTGVDEYERNRVLSTLHLSNANGQFPWFIGEDAEIEVDLAENRPHAPKAPQPTTNNSDTYISTNQHPINNYFTPIMPTQYYPVVPTLSNHTNYPSNQHVEGYITKTSPMYYGATTPSNIYVPVTSYYPVVHTNNQFVAGSIAAEANFDDYSKTSPLSVDSPVFTPKNLYTVPVEEPVSDKRQPHETTDVPVITGSIRNSEILFQGDGQAIKGKSWASLFTRKPGHTSSTQVNGILSRSVPFQEPVTKDENKVCPIRNAKVSSMSVDPGCYRMGEFLKNYMVDGRAISLKPRGLINQSNYCYINSILQALIACPPMYNLLTGLAHNISSNAKRKPTPVIDGMCKFVKEYRHLPASMRVNNHRRSEGKRDMKTASSIVTDFAFEPAWIYKILHDLQTDLREGRQEDAEEFLGCLLNNLSDEMADLMNLVEPATKTDDNDDNDGCGGGDEETNESWQVMGTKNKGSVLRKTDFERTPITDIFGGSLKSRISRAGGMVTENTQPFLTLPLNIEKVKTVCEAFENLTTKNQLEGITSTKTNEEVEAWQQVMLDELPVVLVLHLKCFDFQLDGCTKIVKALEFPIDLKIDGKLLSLKTNNAKEKQYKLFAIVYHDGKEATKGHYITDAFHVGYSSWLRYDDATVKEVQEDQVLNPQGTRVPYLLFYRRSDTITRSK